MKSLVTPIFALFLMFFAKNGDAQSRKAGKGYEGNFVLSFYSIGSGKNGRAYTKFNSFIREFNSKNNPKIQYDIIDWGKEGEKDVCFHPNGNANFNEFIKQIRELLTNEPLIEIKEHGECRKTN